MSMSQGFKASMELYTRINSYIPFFTDIFDEETFYIFAICFTLGTIALVFVLSRFITLKEVEW